LQYFGEGIWRDAPMKIACFRGAEDDLLEEGDQGSLTPPTFHRAVPKENLRTPVPSHLAKNGLVRAAMPLFVSVSTAGARRVRANSDEIHHIAA
jgi:hypothetical protein